MGRTTRRSTRRSGFLNPPPLVLRASLLDRVITIGSPGLLLALGVYGVANAGWAGVGGVLVGVGALLLALAAWSMPWVTTIDEVGVHWRTPVRSRRIPWDDIVAFQRHRGRAGGPLVVRTVERRRVAVTTTTERPSDWDALRELVDRHAPGVAMASAPPAHPFNRTGAS